MLIVVLQATGYPRTLDALGTHIGRPELVERVARFLAIQNGEDPAAPDRNLAWYMDGGNVVMPDVDCCCMHGCIFAVVHVRK